MILRLPWLLVGLLPFVFADVEFISPKAGATLAAGGAIKIEWKDSGDTPALATLLNYQLFLCAGGNEAGAFVRISRHSQKLAIFADVFLASN